MTYTVQCIRCRDALATSTINCVTSFFAGFVIFSVLGYMSKKSRTPIDKVATEGEFACAAAEFSFQMFIGQILVLLFMTQRSVHGFGNICRMESIT